MRIQLGAFYIDNLREVDTAQRPTLINTFPFDEQTAVPAADRLGSHPIYLTVVDVGAAGLTAGGTTIEVDFNGGGFTQIFDGTSFIAGWSTSSTYSAVASDGGATVDEHRFCIVRDTAFTSLDVISVRVQASTTDVQSLNTTYSFTVEDLTAPLLLSARTHGLKRVRVTFNEAMKMFAAVTDAVAATGQIQVVPVAQLIDGETFTLDDGTNDPTVFEFDDDATFTSGNVAVDISGLTTAVEVRDKIIDTINMVGDSLRIVASVGQGTLLVDLTHEIAGAQGNVDLLETVADTDFVVRGMSGGVGEVTSENVNDPGNALRIRDLSGGIEIRPREPQTVGPDLPPRIIASRDVFVSTDVGLFVGVAGAENALNNEIFTVVSVIDAKTVEINSERVLVETLPTGLHQVTIGPYKLNGVADTARLLPFFNPIVLSASKVSDAVVELVLHDSITQNRDYTVSAIAVEDLAGNALALGSVQFTTEPCGAPQARLDADFTYPKLLPQANLTEDATGDLERFANVIDEPMQLLLCDVDLFTTVYDLDLVEEQNLNALLIHLGAPYTFMRSLSVADKRRLASVLVDSYKRGGVEAAIESFVRFVLGVDIDIQAFTSGDYWVLGEDTIGDGTLLGIGDQFTRYSFIVVSPVVLTVTQRRRITEVVEFMKPAHTHFLRLDEPGTSPTAVISPWTVGVSELGIDTTIP